MHIKHSERARESERERERARERQRETETETETEREREITLERVSQYKNTGYPTIFKATPNIFLNPLFFFRKF